MIDHKGTGVAAFASVSSRAVTGTTLTNNANGINTDSATGVVCTSGNNWFRLNTADGDAMLNVPLK